MNLEAINDVVNKANALTRSFSDKMESIFGSDSFFAKVFNITENIRDPEFLVSLILNLLIVYVFYRTIKIIALNAWRSYSYKKMADTMSKRKSENILYNLSWFSQYKKHLQNALAKKNASQHADLVVFVTFGVNVLIGMYFVAMKQPLIGLIWPFIMIKFWSSVVATMEFTKVDYYRANLPKVIDVFLKTATKYEDLRNIFAASAPLLPGRMKKDFEALGRKMGSREPEDVLNDWRNEFEDIWISSFVFILLSMKQTTSKEVAVANLMNLRDMLNDENKLKEKSVSDKRLTVMTNLVLSVFGVLIAIITQFFPIAREFFFQTPMGLLAFLGGIAMVLATIKINIRQLSLKD